MDALSEIKNRLSVFTNFYDIIRIVDPLNNKVIFSDDIGCNAIDTVCYEFWKRNNVCKNCISMRAYVENNTLMKVENIKEEMFLTISSPINFKGNIYVVEMIKNITTSGIMLKTENENIYKIDHSLLKLNDEVLKDPLTGLYNRRFIETRLPDDISKNFMKSAPISIIIADLDFFKKVNDKYGHIAGDIVLKGFAELINSCIRKSTDWAARYGGEELLIFLNDTDENGALRVAKKIKKLLAGKEFIFAPVVCSKRAENNKITRLKSNNQNIMNTYKN